MATAADSAVELEPTPPDVKEYNRLKFRASLISLALSLTFLAAMALFAGPKLDQWVRGLVGENRWVRLVALAVVYGIAFELISLPLSFWSGFVLEHRYHLSNQRFPAWLWRQIKGYLIGGP